MTKAREDYSAPQEGPLPEREAPPLPWLTFEVAFYALLALAALAVRLAALGRWPLLESEANTALAAWRAIHGPDWKPLAYSPLLYDADLLLFWATRATDAASRLLPAGAGVGLVILPYFLRDLLGRKGALAASVLLALAPSWIYFSRTADGAITATAAGALLLTAIWRSVKDDSPRWVKVAVVALGLGLTTGPGFWTMLLAAALFWGVAWWRRGAGFRAEMRATVARFLTRDSGLLLAGVFLFFASGFLTNWNGIAASLNLLGRWAGDLTPGSTDLGWLHYPRALAGYELLTLFLALGGAAWGLRKREAIDMFLVAWVVLALFLGMALGHREPAYLLDALLPLVALAARGVEVGWGALLPEANVLDGLLVLVSIPILSASFLAFFEYAQTAQATFLMTARIIWLVMAAAWLVYLIWGDRKSALVIGSTLALLVMGVITIRSTTAIAYQTARDPREKLVYHPSSAQLSDLEALVTTLSSHQAGDPYLLDIEYEAALNPWMGWYLRDYPNAQEVTAIGPQPQATALIMRRPPKEQYPSGYMGQHFRLQETWSSQGITDRDWLRWLIYRYPTGTIQASEVEVWVRPPTAK